MSEHTANAKTVRVQALVTSVYGSAPTKVGAELLLHADGSISGNLGGGHLEHDVRLTLQKAAERLPWTNQRFVLGGENDQCCGGVVEVSLVSIPLDLSQLLEQRSERQYRREGEMLRLLGGQDEDGRILGGFCPLSTSTAPHPGWLADGHIFVVPKRARQPLWIFGAGHVGRAIAHLACHLPFAITVFDTRPEWLDPSAFPTGLTLCQNWTVDTLPEADPHVAVLILTYSHALDFQLLRHWSKKTLAYIGVIASKSKAARFRHQAAREDWSLHPLLHMPMGLPGMGKEPYEISISVLAELLSIHHQQQKRKGEGYANVQHAQ